MSPKLTCEQNIKEGLEGHPATWYSDIFELVFPNLDREKANVCLACEWKKNNKAKSEESSDKDE
jgi:Lon-like ATP-dependent protease